MITIRGLRKAYGDHAVLDGLDLDVAQGEVVALLGPNGAGKTTTVRILSTLLAPDEGTVTVAGHDVVRDPARVRAAISLTGQFAAVDSLLTGEENLHLMARLAHLSRAERRNRPAALLELFDLTDAARRPVKTYSGGMRRRLDLAVSLLSRPQVLVLDEPTTGLDPRGRAEMWEVIQTLVAGGTTLLLTTQYLEEADVLADDIVVIDHGKVIAQGTADQLKLQVGGERLDLTVADETLLEQAAALLEPLGVGKPTLDASRRSLLMPVTGGARTLTEALRRLDDAGITLDDVGLRRPTLDDVFLTLTGRPAEDDETETKGDA